jgi:hypothetical protein
MACLLGLAFAGCGPKDDESGSGSDTGGSGDGTGGDGTGGGGTGDGGTGTATDDTCDEGAELPDDAACDCDEECLSQMCFYVELLGGYCSECLSDADCPDGGCSVPNPMQGLGAECNQGELGAGCETDEACQEPLFCVEVIDVGALGLEVKTCSECRTDDDCDGDLLCSPQLDVLNFTGQLACVEAGSVPDGEACNYEGNGDAACASGICAELDVQGILQFGVCGECRTDEDCQDGLSCTPPELDINTAEIIPSVCGDGGTGTGTDTGTGTGTGAGTATGTGTGS